MGNREALLEGAKRCLIEKGYARTTARDIADAAGVSLAAIGYHYGSKESLLEQAFMAAMEEWFEDDEGDRHQESPAGSLERFQAFFGEVIGSFPEQEPLGRPVPAGSGEISERVRFDRGLAVHRGKGAKGLARASRERANGAPRRRPDPVRRLRATPPRW